MLFNLTCSKCRAPFESSQTKATCCSECRLCRQCRKPFRHCARDIFCTRQCRNLWRNRNGILSPMLQFLLDSVKRHGASDACLEWPFCRNVAGYGRLSKGGREEGPSLVPRVSYEAFVGPIPPGKCILHKCDNPPCYNPLHLKPGTKRENTEDMMKKGRHHKTGLPGQRHPMRKLSAADVLEIRNLYDPTKKRTGAGKLALRFNVDRDTIARAATGKTWSDLGI